MPKVFEWNGQDVPEELRKAPPGRYVFEAVDDEQLSEEEDAKIVEALASLKRGEGIPGEAVHAELDEWAKTARSRAKR